MSEIKTFMLTSSFKGQTYAYSFFKLQTSFVHVFNSDLELETNLKLQFIVFNRSCQ